MAKRHPSSKLIAELGAAAIDTSITLWWRWPILLSAGLPSKDSRIKPDGLGKGRRGCSWNDCRSI
jgi:hypothetical protein